MATSIPPASSSARKARRPVSDSPAAIGTAVSPPQLPVGAGGVRAQRVLDPERPEALELAEQAGGGGRLQSPCSSTRISISSPASSRIASSTRRPASSASRSSRVPSVASAAASNGHTFIARKPSSYSSRASL